jgi:uncharacterized protein
MQTQRFLITGGSQGIGAALVALARKAGHQVVFTGRNESQIASVAAETGAHGLRADVSVDADNGRTVDACHHHMGGVDVLVNNAGFGFGGPFHKSDLELEIEQLRVLCEVPIALTRTFLPGMVERREGAVINMASTAGMQPLPNSAGYAAAKAHMLSFSEAVHMEVRRLGVTVTAVCPGPVFTELFDKNYHPVVRVPRALWLQADEVAEAALRGAERGRRVVVPGAVIRAGAPLLRITPRMVALRVAERAFR